MESENNTVTNSFLNKCGKLTHQQLQPFSQTIYLIYGQLSSLTFTPPFSSSPGAAVGP